MCLRRRKKKHCHQPRTVHGIVSNDESREVKGGKYQLADLNLNYFKWNFVSLSYGLCNQKSLIKYFIHHRFSSYHYNEYKGSSYDLATSEDEVLGRAVRTSEAGRNPVFVSVGTGGQAVLRLEYLENRLSSPPTSIPSPTKLTK